MTTKISGDNISAIANTGVSWNAVTVADGSTQLNASAGNGYFLDTNAGIIEVFLPSSPTRGDTVILADYSGTFATNQIIINTGGVNIDSTVGSEFKVTTNNSIVECVYVDSAKGWFIKLNQTAGTTPTITGNEVGGSYDSDATYISATGGTVTESGDFKIHTFTGDGCFVVSCGGNPAGSDTVDYLVVAGGGGGAYGNGGGGGAGGFRESHSVPVSGCYTASPLTTPAGITVSATTYPVTVGGGGAGGGPGPQRPNVTSGSNSVFSTITSTGGGRGGSENDIVGAPGGSGGGAPGNNAPTPGLTGGSGNTPPVSPPQGQPGGNGSGSAGPLYGSGGGGGAGTSGTSGSSSATGSGGDGVGTQINPAVGESGPSCLQYFAGGGGANIRAPGSGNPSGGIGGGGDGGGTSCAQAGTANTGGGGGGSEPTLGQAGGKGIVVIRYKFQ